MGCFCFLFLLLCGCSCLCCYWTVGVVACRYFNPWYDLFEMARELLVMFLWHLAPVVADVTLGFFPPPMSGFPVFSEAACSETLHHPESGTWDESVHMCHAVGHRRCTTSECFIVMSPYHRTALAIREIVPNTQVFFQKNWVNHTYIHTYIHKVLCPVNLKWNTTVLWWE